MRLTPRFSILSVLLTACGGAEPGNLAKARTDTLPRGILRVTSDGPTAWSEAAGATLVEELRFQGQDGSPSELGQPRSIAVDDLGRIYVVDEKPAVIKVFAPDGQFIRTIGREGEGPGEFRVGFIAVRGKYLVLQDPQVTRLSVFDTAGTFLRSWHSSCCYWMDIEIDRLNRVYVPSMIAGKPGEAPKGIPYVRWSLEGVALDTIIAPVQRGEKYWTVTVKEGGQPVRSMMTVIPFMPQMLHAVHPDGGLVHGWSGAYELIRSATGGDTVRLFARSWTPEPITEERRMAEVERRIRASSGAWGEANVRNAFHLEDVPNTFPAYQDLAIDPSGRIWVARFAVADTTTTAFDLFDSTGAWLGPVTAQLKPGFWRRQVWTKDGVVTVGEDEEGRPTVVRLRLEVSARHR